MKTKRVVIKVGTSTLTYDTGHINLKSIECLSRTIADIKNRGIEVCLVSSGAIGVGMGRLRLKSRPTEVKEKQAAAAVGQVELINMYSKILSEYGVTAAQVLLTKFIVDDTEGYNNTVNTLHQLLEYSVLPIINENDTVSTHEIEFGDNDTLSARVACMADADLLILLTDIDGLYDADPRVNNSARLISEVYDITDELISAAGGSGTNRGTGGMATKLKAAEIAAEKGIDTVIANGKNPSVLYDIIDGKKVGTKIFGKKV